MRLIYPYYQFSKLNTDDLEERVCIEIDHKFNIQKIQERIIEYFHLLELLDEWGKNLSKDIAIGNMKKP